MKKRGQLTLFVAIAVFLVAAIVLVSLLKKTDSPQEDEIECQTDSDCVPSICCHATSCTSKFNEPDCAGTFCTAVCEPGTLDCNQGSCLCQFNKCRAVLI